MSMISSRLKYYNKLQYKTDSTSHLRRVPSRVRVMQGLRPESSRESPKRDLSRDSSRVESPQLCYLTIPFRRSLIGYLTIPFKPSVFVANSRDAGSWMNASPIELHINSPVVILTNSSTVHATNTFATKLRVLLTVKRWHTTFFIFFILINRRRPELMERTLNYVLHFLTFL